MIATVRRALVVSIALSGAVPNATGCADPFFEATTRLRDTRDTRGPYTVTTVAIGVEEGDRVELFYNVVDAEPENFIPLVMDAAEDDDAAFEGELFSRGIPGQRPGSDIRYYVAITRDSDTVAEDPEGGDLRPFVFSVLP